MSNSDNNVADRNLRWARRSFLVYWVVLLALMHYPKAVVPGIGMRSWDKICHFVAYGTLTALLGWWLFARRWPPRVTQSGAIFRKGILIVLAVMTYALVDEWTQPLTGRQFDWWDWVVDSAAAITVGAAVTLYALSRARSSEHQATRTDPATS